MAQKCTLPPKVRTNKANSARRARLSRALRLTEHATGAVEYYNGVQALFAEKKRALSVSPQTLNSLLQYSHGGKIDLGEYDVERVVVDKSIINVIKNTPK